MDSKAQSSEVAEAPRGRRGQSNLFSWIMGAVAAGVIFGLFFGELVGGLRLVGDAYVGLLQMTVLPYIVFALVSSIGRLTIDESKRLAKVSVMTLLALWVLGCLTVAAMSLSLPPTTSGSFFSAKLIERHPGVDFIELFVPSNPFSALANNIAPAVVVFCIMFGVALVKVERKQSLLEQCDTIVTTLLRVNKFVVQLSPIGIFAITASAAGTLSLEEFGRLQAYLLVFSLSALLLSLLVLPMLVAAWTPFRYRDIISVSKDVLVTVFVIQSLFVVIPMIAEGVKRLTEDYAVAGGKTDVSPDFVIPIAYPFPHLGKVATLIFIPFAAWFYGTTIPWTDFPLFLSTGLVLSFGKVVTTIPFLLDLMELPTDIFQLFLLSSVFAGGFSDIIGAMHLIAFTLMVTCTLSGLVRFNRAKFVAAVGLTLLVGGAMILSARILLSDTLARSESEEMAVRSMRSLEKAVPTEILPTPEPNPVPLLPGQSRLERLQDRGVLRAGYRTDDLPFSFLNSHGELVGLDIDMARNLAFELGVSIEFVPFTVPSLADQLAADHFDVAFTGIATTTRQSLIYDLSEPYLDVTLAFIVPDYLKSRFSTLESIRKLGPFSLGVLNDDFSSAEIHEVLPQARIVDLESVNQFFEDQPEPIDALLFDAEGGSAWTLIHSNYTVVNPLPHPIRVPIAYPYAGPDQRFAAFLQKWIQLKRKDHVLDRLYNHWILGEGAKSQEPRWSVIRDVLQWVD